MLRFWEHQSADSVAASVAEAVASKKTDDAGLGTVGVHGPHQEHS
ncbi:hypothetical protein ACFFIO_06840 [Citricoccus parietis]|uniref:Uncharacterized protein n=1 Tax=Citricoccus parietis TaxID=592307 RepID=A0ABV6F3X9_9MICC